MDGESPLAPSFARGVGFFLKKTMPTIKINNVEYDSEKFSKEAKAQLQMLIAVDAEIKRLQVQLAISQTAKNAYAQALAQAVNPLSKGDTIRF